MIMKKYIKKNWLLSVLAIFIAMATLSSCKKTTYPLLVNPGLNITQYFENNPTQFSLFDQILERTGYSGFLGAYGAYTVFAPDNNGVNLYLKGLGKTSVDQVDVNVLKDMVRLHVIQDTLTTANFTDGKLPTPTLYGQFLTTGATNINGVSSYTVNKQATILQTNLRFGNGIVHVIDHVLLPATLTIAQTIAQNPKYSIFSQALTATGFYDTLNVAASANTNPNRKYFTLLAQTDSVFIANGISSFAALKAKYSFTGNPLNNPTDSLYLFVAYHILAENSYLSDIISVGSHATLATGEVISDVLQGQTILINNDTFNGILEPGIPIDRPNSDVTTTNGVLHSALGNIHIKVRTPARVDWDLGDQPEFRKQTTIFRRAGQTTINYTPGQLVDIMVNGGLINYSCDASTSTNFYWWDDHLNLGTSTAGFRSTPAGLWNDCVFRTPTIIKGKYKVWFSWRSGGENGGAQFFFDGQPLQNVITAFTTGMPNGTDSDPVLESKGYKRYSAAPSTNTTQVSILLGVVNVATTDRHLLEMVAINGGNNSTITADMIQFIPIDDDQEYPRFARNGTLIPRP
jgi:uncharacterized surface protein with fasciclin (FAS1) repeats